MVLSGRCWFGLTTARLGHFRQPQTREIRRHRLKRDIAVPLIRRLLLLTQRAVRVAAVDFTEQFRADGADLLVWISLLAGADVAFAVEDGVDV